MIRIVLFILCLSFTILADVEVDAWIMPIRIHYSNKSMELAWIEYNPKTFYYQNPEYCEQKRPIPGRSVFFLNKLGNGDSLVVSE
jgi:hypothetical protein